MSKDITILINGDKVKICENVINSMYNHIQKGILSKESGGILIGKENKSDENIVIKHLTSPMDRDKRRYNKFIRQDKKHLDTFYELYRSSNETLRYIGEWHTHPEAIPNFSNIDLTNWKKIANNTNAFNYYMHIIVGYEAIRVWLITCKGDNVQLISTIYWKDVK